MSTMAFEALLAQDVQASMPAFCSAGLAFIICSNDVRGAL
jgi:hypothetical protein